jgi:hypothetical protein
VIIRSILIRAFALIVFAVLLTSQFGSAQVSTDISNDNSVPLGWIREPLKADGRIGFRSWHRLTYDPVQQKILAWMAVSGCDDPWSNALWAYETASNTFLRKTWSGSGNLVDGNCTRPVFLAQSPHHPGDRHPYHQMAYDTTRGRMWIYGGIADNGKCDASGPGFCSYVDTWYYDSRTNTWSCTDTGGGCNNETSKMTNPGRRTEGAMVYDSENDVVVLFGSLLGGNPTNDTWHYSPSTDAWTRVLDNGAPSLPPAREANSMAYDSVDHKIVMFSGTGKGKVLLNDIWFYDAERKRWTNPKPQDPPPGARFPVIAYDPSRNLVVYYKGPGNLWAYSGTTNQWTKFNIAGGPTIEVPAGVSMAYDVHADTYVLMEAQGRQVWQLKLARAPGSSSAQSATAAPEQEHASDHTHCK